MMVEHALAGEPHADAVEDVSSGSMPIKIINSDDIANIVNLLTSR
jgi:hypothetical protein